MFKTKPSQGSFLPKKKLLPTNRDSQHDKKAKPEKLVAARASSEKPHPVVGVDVSCMIKP